MGGVLMIEKTRLARVALPPAECGSSRLIVPCLRPAVDGSSRVCSPLEFLWPCERGSNSERHLHDEYNIRATIQTGAAQSGDK